MAAITGVRGYHPPLAVAAGSGDVLMARPTAVPTLARGAAHFLGDDPGSALPERADN